MEKYIKHYTSNTDKNCEMATENPEDFAQQCNNTLRKLKTSKAKDWQALKIGRPIRIYGVGDYVPQHYEFLKELDFDFYIISKSIIRYKEIDKVLQLNNLSKLVLSYYSGNLNLYTTEYYEEPKINYAFTGTSEEFSNALANRGHFDLFYNIEKNKAGYAAAKQYRNACPVDSGRLELAEACVTCSRCYS